MTASPPSGPLRRCARQARFACIGFAAAFLPEPWRDRIARPVGLDPGPYSFLVGLVQAPLGTGLFFTAWIAYMSGGLDASLIPLLERWWPGMTTTHVRGLGLVNAMGWMFHPLAWVLGYVAVTGFARVMAYVSAGEALSEPALVAGARTAGLLRGWLGARRRRSALGPARPDRFRPARNGELLLLTCRERTDWSPSTTIEVRGRFYRVVGKSDRREGAWTTVAYRLRELGPNEVVRGLVRYERTSG